MKLISGLCALRRGFRVSIALLCVAALCITALTFATPQTADAQSGVSNNCPAADISVALYGGSVSNGLIAGRNFLNEAPGFCVQVIDLTDWAAMTVSEFQLFDVLWIGNDDCEGRTPADFDVAVQTLGTWEAAIDAGSVMVAGGDYDYHYEAGQANAIAVTQALVTEISDATAPGLVLQAGCYAVTNSPWFQNLGGSFAGLMHAHLENGDPTADEVTDHEFNVKYGFDETSYAFVASCHGGVTFDAASPVANYQLQPLFEFAGFPCFMFSDASVAPTFRRDIGGTVWCDTTRNDLFDVGEGLAGITVTLTNNAGVSISTVTGANGEYLFVDQIIGTYTVAVDAAGLPADCNVVAVDPDGGDDASAIITTTIGSTDNLDQDFGFSAPEPGPTPDPTPDPTPGPTPDPTPGPTPDPTPGPTTVPTPDPTPVPTAIVDPVPPATPAAAPAPIGPVGPLTAPTGPDLPPVVAAFSVPNPSVADVPAAVPGEPQDEVLGITIEAPTNPAASANPAVNAAARTNSAVDTVASTSPPLAISGADSDTLSLLGMALLGTGAVLSGTARVRRRKDS